MMVVGTMDALRDRVKACVSAGPRPARVGAGFGSRPRRAREAALRALPFAEGQRRLVLARAKPGGEGSRYEPKSDGAGSDGAAPEPTAGRLHARANRACLPPACERLGVES